MGVRESPARTVLTEMAGLVDSVMRGELRGVSEQFRSSVDVAEFLRLVRARGTVAGALYVPEAIRALGERAARGDVEAARALLSYTLSRAGSLGLEGDEIALKRWGKKVGDDASCGS